MIKKERLQEIYGNEAAEAEARFQNLTEQYQAKFGGEPKRTDSRSQHQSGYDLRRSTH